MAYLDSRDLQERIDKLEKCRRDGEIYDHELEELKDLIALKEECQNYGWDDGIYFISDYEFRDYAMELAYDCYLNNDVNSNPMFNYIDWDEWADAVQRDYESIEFRGNTYYFREA